MYQKGKVKMKLFKRIICMCAVLSMLLCVTVMSAQAAEASSEFDFSSVDTIDQYDQYQKDITDQGVQYVYVNKYYWMNSSAVRPIGDYRYSAFLRDSSEKQYYGIENMDFGSSRLCENVLTIYADPGVEFTLENHHGITIADSAGRYTKTDVAYYKKSIDNGHYVYYIELVPAAKNETLQMLTFSTKLDTTQPHYSFWFGTALPKVASVDAGTVTLSVQKPNSSTAGLMLTAPYTIPDRAWTKTVTVTKVRESGSNNLTGLPYIYVTLPGETKSLTGKMLTGTEVQLTQHVNSVYATLASGKYKFNLGKVEWSRLSSNTATYQYTGRVTIEYIYAFGA